MSEIIIYGIKNCDTMKKTFQWFDVNNIPFTFHDYKKQDVDKNVLSLALKEHGWEIVLNRRGTTWRKLPDDIKASMNQEKATKIALENPSIIKRPLIKQDEKIILGFNSNQYQNLFQ